MRHDNQPNINGMIMNECQVEQDEKWSDDRAKQAEHNKLAFLIAQQQSKELWKILLKKIWLS